jgi:cytochrome P450
LKDPHEASTRIPRQPTPPYRFPIGAAVELAELERDPYPIYARLRTSEPISWLAALNMWYVTGYENVRTIILDTERFTTASKHSLLHATFGAHLLTTEGAQHDRYRLAIQAHFSTACIRSHFEKPIRSAAAELIEGFRSSGRVELRGAFARRLPVQGILIACGLPLSAEARIRQWYDSFEAALANFTRDPTVQLRAQHDVAAFHEFLDAQMQTAGRLDASLLEGLVNAPPDRRLAADEIKRNLSIILFGGISTVEALILNTLWALFEHPHVLSRLRTDSSLLPQVLDETIRWLSPVQSATRHVVLDCEFAGVHLAAGATVNCMLGAANRDPSVFPNPDRFDIERANLRRHLGFATGPHSCVGFNLAKAEARVAIEELLNSLPKLTIVGSESGPLRGYEFRQPAALTIRW